MWEWQLDAACAEIGSDLWFPDKGKSSSSEEIKKLVAVCAGCPVRAKCLAAALRIEGDCGKDFRHGIWGGTTPLERHHIVKGPRKQRVQRDDNLCPKGLHEMTDENLYVHPTSGYRECRTCKRARQRNYDQRKAG